jgi:HAD superfamily hydrolase (TIGR01490 family)
MSTRAAAIFDLDRTLLQVNSATLWFKRERAAGRLPLGQAVEAAGWMGLYGLGLMRGDVALGRAVRGIAGEAEAVVQARLDAFYDEELAHAFAPGGLAALQAHQRAGDATVLLTSASAIVARRVQAQLGIDAALGLELEVEDGLYTGRIAQLSFGRAKVELAERWAEEHGVDLGQSWFYSDSISDLPLLERVGRAMVVQPDVRLARLARRRGWPILDWGTAA